MFNRGPDTPEYGAAKKKMESFTIGSKEMEKAVSSMTNRIKSIAKFYTEFGQKIFATWASDAPPAVAQAEECVQKNAAMFETLIDTLINQLGPQFYNLLTIHDAQLKELQALDKKRLNALKESQNKERTLNNAKNAKEPQEEKIQSAQTQYDQAKSQFDEVDAQFLEEVKAFEEKRNVKLTEAFQNLMGMFCQFVNQASLLQPIDFPEDINGEVVEPPQPQQRPLPPSNPAPVQTPAPQPASAQPPYTPPAQTYNQPPPEPYNPPPSQPEPQPESTYDNTSYAQQDNTYNDTSYAQQDNTYNDTSYAQQQDYNYNNYNNYNEQEAQPDPTPSYQYEAPANNDQPAQSHQDTKNPFDEDEDGYGSNPFG